jgi:hypothetical protein
MEEFVRKAVNDWKVNKYDIAQAYNSRDLLNSVPFVLEVIEKIQEFYLFRNDLADGVQYQDYLRSEDSLLRHYAYTIHNLGANGLRELLGLTK